MKYRFGFVAVCAAVVASVAIASEVKLDVKSNSFSSGDMIPTRYAFCAADGNGASAPAQNISPELNWSAGPEGTKSYAVIAVDPDVPAVFDDASKAGKILNKDMPRRDYFHWVLVNIPASMTFLPEGIESNEHNPKGKPAGKVDHGLRGINDYSSKTNPFGGYDGPCPPWNDERLHHYQFTVYALDIETLPVKEPVTGKAALEAMKDHILAQGTIEGTFSTHPALCPNPKPLWDTHHMNRSTQLLTVIAMIAIVAVARLLPHPRISPRLPPWRFSAVRAQPRPALAFALPLLALLVSDAFIGFYDGMAIVYAATALVVVLGFALKNTQNLLHIAGGSVAGSLVFYLITNLVFVHNSALYPLSMAGQMQSYIAALPFLRNALLGDLAYNFLLFGVYGMVARKCAQVTLAKTA